MSEERHLPNKINAPPGGWRYRVPETGQVFEGASEHDLISRLTAHYKATGYDMPHDIAARIEKFLCSAMPEYCDGDGPVPVPPRLAHTFTIVLQGTRTLYAWWRKGKRLVTLDQATTRAATCAQCPHNQEPVGCTNCNMGALREAVEQIVGGAKTPFHAQLKACNVCSCQLAAKVHLPIDVLWPNMNAEQKLALPDFCWLKKEAGDEA